jgi:hypothetical protein
MSYDNNVEYCDLNTALMLESILLTNNFAIQVEEMEYIEREIFDTSLTQERAIELKAYKFRIDEGQKESMYRKFKSQYDSLRDTMNSIQQDISTLKMELNESKVYNNG